MATPLERRASPQTGKTPTASQGLQQSVRSSNNNFVPRPSKPSRCGRSTSSAPACDVRSDETNMRLQSKRQSPKLRSQRMPRDYRQHRSSRIFLAAHAVAYSALRNNRMFARPQLPRKASSSLDPKSDASSPTAGLRASRNAKDQRQLVPPVWAASAAVSSGSPSRRVAPKLLARTQNSLCKRSSRQQPIPALRSCKFAFAFVSPILCPRFKFHFEGV